MSDILAEIQRLLVLTMLASWIEDCRLFRHKHLVMVYGLQSWIFD